MPISLSALRKSFVDAVKAPALHFNALNKAEKSRAVYYTLGLGGGCMAMVFPVAAIYTPDMLSAVGGTAASGLFVCLSNFGFAKIFEKHTDLSTKEKRQNNRLFEVFTNAVGVARWIPQFVEGMSLSGWEGGIRLFAAGTGMGSYGTGLVKQGIEYGGRKSDPDFKFEKTFPRLDEAMRKVPGMLLFVRSPAQLVAAVTAGVTVHPSVGIVWGTAAVIQGVAGPMVYYRDKHYTPPVEAKDGNDNAPTLT